MQTIAKYPHSAGWKAEDSETSREAAVKVESKAKTLRQKCFECIKGSPMTADEVAELLGEDKNSIRPRFSELKAQNLICDSGERRKNASGTNAVVWKRKEQKLTQQNLI